MKVSIITVCYNSGATIGDTLRSVQEQSYKNIEHIIVDGLSTDNTLEVLSISGFHISKTISEKDHGIYDAMNKGISSATGDIIGILNSDDYYADKIIVEKIVKIFETKGCDSLFGNLDFVTKNTEEKVIRRWKSSPFIAGSFAKGWHPPHPTFFVKKQIYEQYGNYDISLEVSADFELMLRMIEKNKISTYYLDETIVKMRYGGESTSSIKKIVQGNRNIMKAFKKNNIPVSLFYPIIRLLPKVKQFLTK